MNEQELREKICVVGQLQNRPYEDKEGNKRIVTEIPCGKPKKTTNDG